MRQALVTHGIAFTVVLTIVSLYALNGGLQTTPQGSTVALLFSVFVTVIAAGAVRGVAEYQAWRGKPSLAGPLVWGATVAWLVSLFLLLDHPRSLSTGSPVLSSLAAAALLIGPFALYWTIYFCIGRRMPRNAG